MQALRGENLLFLPGLDGTGISFEPLRPFIASDADVTIVRYPNDELLSFQQIVQCTADQISVRDDAIVVAESLSGPVAIELIGSGRLKAKCLVLCATFARSPRPLLLNIGLHLPLEKLMALPIPEMLLRLFFGGMNFSETLIPLWHRINRLVVPSVLSHRLRIVSRLDVRHRLPKITLPCLYIQASSDILVPQIALSDFVTAISDLKVKRLDGPHSILQARPRESIAMIDDFRKNIIGR